MKITTKKRISYAVVLFVLLAGTLCSCSFVSFEKKSAKETTFEKNIDRDNKHVTLNIEGVANIDADYNIPASLADLKMNRITACRAEINEEKCEAFFMKNVSVEKTLDKGYYAREVGTYDITQYSGGQAYMECDPMNMFYVSDGDREDRILNGIQTDEQFDSYNLDKFSLKKDLPFASREQVFKKIKEAYYEISGIEISDDYKAYALDHTTLEEQQSALQKEGLVDSPTKNWSEKDDTYYFILNQEVDGVPVRQKGYGEGYQDVGVEDTDLTVLYNVDGWLDFREQWGYRITDTEEEQEVMDIDSALASFWEKCNMLTGQNEIWEIISIKLELVPAFIKDNDYEIRPVWVFQSSSASEEEGSAEIMFDAITGKELIG